MIFKEQTSIFQQEIPRTILSIRISERRMTNIRIPVSWLVKIKATKQDTH